MSSVARNSVCPIALQTNGIAAACGVAAAHGVAATHGVTAARAVGAPHGSARLMGNRLVPGRLEVGLEAMREGSGVDLESNCPRSEYSAGSLLDWGKTAPEQNNESLARWSGAKPGSARSPRGRYGVSGRSCCAPIERCWAHWTCTCIPRRLHTVRLCGVARLLARRWKRIVQSRAIAGLYLYTGASPPPTRREGCKLLPPSKPRRCTSQQLPHVGRGGRRVPRGTQ